LIGSLLIANRGEIARRIIRTARRMGVRTIAVHSAVDAGAAHVREADVAVEIGAAIAADSYLRAERVLEAARASGAEAIHPGYGFLSENAAFAEAAEAAGLVWVGPPPAAIQAMGLKDAAKRLMAEAGVPVTPGWQGDDQDSGRLAKEAARIGWPVLIKAVAGGGGKGMRKVERAKDFADALASAQREAMAAFGDARVLLEKFVNQPRHIEVQVFADSHGGAVHLFERDCSIQRRHQKVIEEAPAPGMDDATRETLCSAAVRAARAVGYRGAGTVEFIADASEGLRADRIWFMEMNTRLQVEHPVTEAITGVDLVEWQLRVASGEPLPMTQEQIRFSGWAMEARLYAEDPATGFLPSTGRLRRLTLPKSLRVDSAVEEGDWVTPFYDPMIAKLISHAPTRAAAVAALETACAQVAVWPVKTNAWFLKRCLADDSFISGGVDTGFVDRKLEELARPPTPSPAAKAATVAALAAAGRSGPVNELAEALFAFRLNGPAVSLITVNFADGSTEAALSRSGPGYEIEIDRLRHLAVVNNDESIQVDGRTFEVVRSRDGRVVVLEDGAAFEAGLLGLDSAGHEDASDGAVRSPMPGRIVSVGRRVGETIEAGQVLVTLEAMKMEHALKAPLSGVVVELAVDEGDQVNEGAVLARIEA
jgi:propionyl-CoA carboxylase alpha chain/3-methylcrotonyl-CoA carboxylase alpha subunit